MAIMQIYVADGWNYGQTDIRQLYSTCVAG